MKKLAIIAIAAVAFASCGKDDVPPVTGYNSQLILNKTNFYNLPLADSVTGNIAFKFIVKKDSTQNADTTEFTQSFQVTDPTSARTIYFNTPEHTMVSDFTIRFNVYGALADSINISQVTYKKDEKTLLDQPLYFNGTKTNKFTSKPLTYNF